LEQTNETRKICSQTGFRRRRKYVVLIPMTGVR
jgi:hypothetical protein